MKILGAALLMLPLVACGSDNATPASSASASAAPAAKTSSSPAASAAPKPSAAPSAAPAASASAPAAEMVEIDLSSADPAWKGWVANGPKDAKVLADGVHGARIAANGMDAFDVAFGQGKAMLKTVKSGVEAGVKGSGGSLKVTYTTDTADKLEWTTEVGSTKTYNFVWSIKASGKDMSCSTNTMMGASEAMVAQLKTACGTLKKK